ncbi:MAG: helix-turn-helix domain-containing protein [Bdellovibrionales bacterium]
MSSDQTERFKNLLVFIQNHLNEPLPIGRLAEQVGLSKWHFQRVFQSRFSISAGDYVRQQRLMRALETLKTSDKSIKEVAQENQFSTTQTFSRAFKRTFGFSPRQSRTMKNPIENSKPGLWADSPRPQSSANVVWSLSKAVE